MLKRFMSILLLSLIAFGLIWHDAEARRFGGGRSFGSYQSRSYNSAPNRSYQAPYTNRTPNQRSWLGPILGLAAGGLLASLFMGHGMGTGMLSWLMVGLVIYCAVKVFRQSRQSFSPPQQMFRQDIERGDYYRPDGNMAGANLTSLNYPVGFSKDDFLRDAKILFSRLQVVNDTKNTQDLRQFVTPEIAAEIEQQFRERGEKDNFTNVITLNADLLNVEENLTNSVQALTASVQFSGLIQEERDHPAAPFKEIWHLRKEAGSRQWLVIGVEQVS